MVQVDFAGRELTSPDTAFIDQYRIGNEQPFGEGCVSSSPDQLSVPTGVLVSVLLSLPLWLVIGAILASVLAF